MKAIDLGISGIKCDAPGCGYENMFGDWGNTKEAIMAENDKWLNTPCPECGANLLTPEDHKMVSMLLEVADITNDLCNDLAEAGMDLGADDEPIIVRIESDGSGVPTFTVTDDEE